MTIAVGVLTPRAKYSSGMASKNNLLQLNPTLQSTGTLPMFVESKSRFFFRKSNCANTYSNIFPKLLVFQTYFKRTCRCILDVAGDNTFVHLTIISISSSNKVSTCHFFAYENKV